MGRGEKEGSGDDWEMVGGLMVDGTEACSCWDVDSGVLVDKLMVGCCGRWGIMSFIGILTACFRCPRSQKASAWNSALPGPTPLRSSKP